MLGKFESGEDVAAVRRFVGLTQAQFAEARASAFTGSETGSKVVAVPTAAAIALLGIAARHPRIIRENLESAA